MFSKGEGWVRAEAEDVQGGREDGHAEEAEARGSPAARPALRAHPADRRPHPQVSRAGTGHTHQQQQIIYRI